MFSFSHTPFFRVYCLGAPHRKRMNLTFRIIVRAAHKDWHAGFADVKMRRRKFSETFALFLSQRVNLIFFLYVCLVLLFFFSLSFYLSSFIWLLIHVLGCRFRRLGSFTYLTCETLNCTLIEKYTVSSASNFNFIYCCLRFSTLHVLSAPNTHTHT